MLMPIPCPALRFSPIFLSIRMKSFRECGRTHLTISSNKEWEKDAEGIDNLTETDSSIRYGEY